MPDKSDTCWQSINPIQVVNQTVDFKLSDGYGTKTLYVFFKDAGTNISNSATGSIDYVSPFTTNEWISIPGGTFKMGAQSTNTSGDNYDPNAGNNEQPVHTVSLTAFKILKYEVSNKEFAFFLNTHGNTCAGSYDCMNTYNTNSRIHFQDTEWVVDAGFDKHPATGMAWYSARAYCQFVGELGDLPSEAQWEYSAVGDAFRIYPWGNNAPSQTYNNYANCWDNTCFDGFDGTSPVGTFKKGASFFGLMDMTGNVSEWMRDEYDYGFYSTALATAQNPVNDVSYYNSSKVIRGGSFGTYYSYDFFLRSTARGYEGYSYNEKDIGFRCVNEQ